MPSFKALVTDLRLGLAVVLAAQGSVVDAFTNLGVPVKIVSSALSVLGLVAAVVQVISDNTPAAPVAPTVVPPATMGNAK